MSLKSSYVDTIVQIPVVVIYLSGIYVTHWILILCSLANFDFIFSCIYFLFTTQVTAIFTHFSVEETSGPNGLFA